MEFRKLIIFISCITLVISKSNVTHFDQLQHDCYQSKTCYDCVAKSYLCEWSIHTDTCNKAKDQTVSKYDDQARLFK